MLVFLKKITYNTLKINLHKYYTRSIFIHKYPLKAVHNIIMKVLYTIHILYTINNKHTDARAACTDIQLIIMDT